ncbi:MAG: ABC transporter substrate-binding protein [Terricaulis silvestris]
MRILICMLMLCMAAPAWGEAPRRIVSLDYCADQYVLALADREQIAALSRGSLRDDSYFRDRARGIRQTRGTLEEVLALHPDLVVRNWGGPWDAAQVYGRFGVPVLQVGDSHTFADAQADLLHAAEALGHAERGETIARDLDARLARLRANAPRPAPPALYLSAGGAVAGAGVLMDDVIRAAGGRNIWQGQSWTVLPLERMIETPPAVIALAFFDTGRTRMNAWSPSRHPAVQRMLAQARTVNLPAAAVSCESWYAVDAAEQLATALRAKS